MPSGFSNFFLSLLINDSILLAIVQNLQLLYCVFKLAYKKLGSFYGFEEVKNKYLLIYKILIKHNS